MATAWRSVMTRCRAGEDGLGALPVGSMSSSPMAAGTAVRAIRRLPAWDGSRVDWDDERIRELARGRLPHPAEAIRKVSLKILGEDFHRSGHVLSLQEEDRVRVGGHLFDDVDAARCERPGEKRQKPGRLLDRLWTRHVVLHEPSRHADDVLRSQLLRHPRNRVVVHDAHRALRDLNQAAHSILIQEFLDDIPEPLKDVDALDDGDGRNLAPGLDPALRECTADGVLAVAAELVHGIPPTSGEYGLEPSDPELFGDPPRQGRIIHDAHLQAVGDAGMRADVLPHLAGHEGHVL